MRYEGVVVFKRVKLVCIVRLLNSWLMSWDLRFMVDKRVWDKRIDELWKGWNINKRVLGYYIERIIYEA